MGENYLTLFFPPFPSSSISFSLAFFNEENDLSQYNILTVYNPVKCHCTSLLQNLWKSRYQKRKPLKQPSKIFLLANETNYNEIKFLWLHIFFFFFPSLITHLKRYLWYCEGTRPYLPIIQLERDYTLTFTGDKNHWHTV